VVPERLEVDPSAVNGEDLIRADDAEQADSYGSPSQAMEALDSFAQSGLLDVRHPYSEDK
jgi:hypothetical protein